jgi:CheY-like chemotaxis protein
VDREVVEVAGPKAARSRILVVDDNQDSGETLGLLLGATGYEVRNAADGETAVRMSAEFRPDVVIMDLGLPGIDGYEAARRIRASLGNAAQPTIIALTGRGREDDLRRSLDAGMDYHLTKPVRIEDLTGLLEPTGRGRP